MPRILIVEDEPDIALALSDDLRSRGIRSRWSATARRLSGAAANRGGN